MTKEQGFIDVNNVDVLNYKSILGSIEDTDCVKKVPAGYAINYGNVQLALTRHAFTLSLGGRIVLEQKRDTCRWSDLDLLRRLNVNRLVAFKISSEYLDTQYSKSKFGTVVPIDNEGTCVGGLLACLIFLDKLKQRHSINLLNLTFRVPQREGFTKYYSAVADRDPKCRYFILDSTVESRQFVLQRLGFNRIPDQINRESLLVTTNVIDLDSAEKNKSYSSMVDPVFCVSVRDMELNAVEITERLK